MKKGLAVFSGSQVVHKLMQDGTVQFGSGSNLASVVISGSLTASADSIEVSNVRENFTATTLGGILVELKQSGSNYSSSMDTRLDNYSSSVNTQIVRLDGRLDTLIGSGDIASTLDTIKEIADFLDGDGAAAADLTERVRAVSASLDTYKTTNDAAVLSQLNAANFKVNGQAISASGGEFRFDGDSNITISELSTGTGSVTLNPDVSITGKLSAANVEASSEVKGATVVSTGKMTAGNVLEVSAGGAVITGLVDLKNNLVVSGSATLKGAATLESSLTVAGVTTLNGALTANGGIDITGDLSGSGTLQIGGAATIAAGLSVVGGASVADGMTVSSGHMTVSSGDIKVSQGAMSVKMTREEAVARGAGEDGDMFYCTSATDEPASAFPRGKAWYFKQNGDWFDAPFYGEA